MSRGENSPRSRSAPGAPGAPGATGSSSGGEPVVNLSPARERAQRWVVIVALALLALVLVQCLVPITLQNVWDADPRSESGKAPRVELQPGQFAWLNVATVMLAAAAMGVHARIGGRIDRWAVGLAGAGVMACLAQMRGDVSELTRCGAWIGAASAGVAMMHLGQHACVRRWVAAALLVLAFPLVVMALWYVAIEHPATVRMFENDRGEFLRSHGWAPDSSMAILYQRRMNNPQFTGPFAMSNVTGSLGAALFVASTVVAIACWRSGKYRPSLIASAATIASAVVLVFARSKGAMAAALLVAGLLAISYVLVARWPRWRIAARLAVVGLVLVPIGAVVVRGMTWRPGETGELSLLVRYQYWEAVPRIISEYSANPGAWLVGIGPEGFRTANLRLKNPFNPEDVISLHQVFLDWIVILGLGGLAWSALVILALWRASATIAWPQPAAQDSQASEQSRRLVYTSIALTLAIFLTQYLVRQHMMYAETALLWLASEAAFATGLSVMICHRSAWAGSAGVALLGASGVLVIHAQIEMTWFHAGSSAMAWLIVGAAGYVRGVNADDAGKTGTNMKPEGAGVVAQRRDPWVWGVVPAWGAVGVVMIALYAVPLQRHDQAMEDVASRLRKGGDYRQVDAAFARALAIMPRDPTTTRAAARLWLEVADGAALYHNAQLTSEALANAEQYLHRASSASGEREDLRHLRVQLSVIDARARLLGDPKDRAQLVPVLEKVLKGSPFSLPDQMTLADTLWELGRVDEAQDAYRRALRLHEQSYLDSARQLQPVDLTRVRERAAVRE